MKRGGKFLVSTTVLAVAACGGQDGKLEIRATPTPLAQGKRPVPYRIAEARGQLAIGNVALALESFRTAAREDPNSIDALTGIAICYDQMGRYDLSRRNYETALALAPSDVALLGAFAASLQLQGLTAEALDVRQEIAVRRAASAAQEPQQLAVMAPPHPVAGPSELEEVKRALSPRVQAPAVDTNAAAPVAMVEPVRSPEADPIKAEAAVPPTIAVASIPTIVVPKPITEPAKIERPKAGPVRAHVQTAALGPTVTIKLPPARLVQSAPVPVVVSTTPKEAVAHHPAPALAPAILPRTSEQEPMPVEGAMELASVVPLQSYGQPKQQPAVVEETGPRLERISMGEIALITSVAPPVWKSTTVARTDQSTTVRFVPLRQASMQPVKVRLLNAARVNRLAARTRTWLNARGWRGLSIGNATATRTRSVILYPAGKRAVAQRLSAQFGFPLAHRSSGNYVTVLLGTDAARRRATRPARA